MTFERRSAEGLAALAARLRVFAVDESEPALYLEGALTAASAAALIAAGETRQVVVGDPTQIALTGRAALRIFAQLRVRCRRPLRVVAATVASIGPQRSFEPQALLHAVASTTRLPTFDVYAGACAA